MQLKTAVFLLCAVVSFSAEISPRVVEIAKLDNNTTIELSPEQRTRLSLPQNLQVLFVNPTFPCDTLDYQKYESNIVIQATESFRSGDLILSYMDNGKLQTVKLKATRLKPTKATLPSSSPLNSAPPLVQRGVSIANPMTLSMFVQKMYAITGRKYFVDGEVNIPPYPIEIKDLVQLSKYINETTPYEVEVKDINETLPVNIFVKRKRKW